MLGLGLLATGCGGRAIVDWDAGISYVCTVDKRGRLACRAIDTHPHPRILDDMPEGGRWSQVSVGNGHACALDEEGYPTCWGDIVGMEVADALPRERLTTLKTGPSTSCGLRASDGSMICLNPDVDLVTVEEPKGRFKRLDVLEGRVCYERDSGEIGCQGVYPLADRTFPNPPVGVYNPVELNAGGVNLCITDEAGRIRCWGRERYGILDPPAGTGYHSLALGQKHACVLNAQDEVVCWGFNGKVGVLDAPTGTFKSLLSGPYFTCGQRPDGDVECWGCKEEYLSETKRLSGDYCVWE